jgi:hypothetical protein
MNDGYKLVTPPRYLKKAEHRAEKTASSIVFFLQNKQMEQCFLAEGILIGGDRNRKREAYRPTQAETYCSNCQRYGHFGDCYQKAPICTIYGKNHQISKYSCKAKACKPD